MVGEVEKVVDREVRGCGNVSHCVEYEDSGFNADQKDQQRWTIPYIQGVGLVSLLDRLIDGKVCKVHG